MTMSSERYLPPNQIKVVAFDFNGTILRDTDTYVAVNVELGQSMGLKGLTAQRYRDLAGTPGRDWTHPFRVVASEESNETVLKMHKEPVNGTPSMDQTMEGKYQVIYERHMDHQKDAWSQNPDRILAPGALKTVSDLQQQGIKVVFISTQYKEQIIPLFQQSGLLPLLQDGDVIGGVSNKGVAMREVMNREGIEPSQLLYVGDERKDGVHAREAGAQFAHVASGINTPDRVKADLREGERAYFMDGTQNTKDLVNAINKSVANSTPMSNLEFSSTALTPSLSLAS